LKKIKVAYIISTLESCGPVNILFNLVKYLDKTKYEPLIITLSPEQHNSRIADFKRIAIPVHSLNLSRIQGILLAKNKIKKLIAENEIEIVHGQSFRADQLIASLKGVKKATTLHNYPYLDFPMTYGRIQGYLMATQHYRSIRKLDCPVACSKSVANFFKKNQNYPMIAIQNGVDLDNFKVVMEEEKHELRKKLELPLNKTIFLVIGTLTQRKDPLTVIEAFKRRNVKDELLIFLGSGDLEEECQKLGNSRNILFLGQVKNVAEYLQASDIYLSAALAEGLPNTVLEALACGIPSILSGILPHKEILAYDRSLENYLFEAEDTEDLNKKIGSLLASDLPLISAKSRKLIEENLSASVMASNYESVYKQLMGVV